LIGAASAFQTAGPLNHVSCYPSGALGWGAHISIQRAGTLPVLAIGVLDPGRDEHEVTFGQSVDMAVAQHLDSARNQVETGLVGLHRKHRFTTSQKFDRAVGDMHRLVGMFDEWCPVQTRGVVCVFGMRQQGRRIKATDLVHEYLPEPSREMRLGIPAHMLRDGLAHLGRLGLDGLTDTAQFVAQTIHLIEKR
jgi:hypothetical protein